MYTHTLTNTRTHTQIYSQTHTRACYLPFHRWERGGSVQVAVAQGQTACYRNPRAGTRTKSLGSQANSEERTNEALSRKVLRKPWTVPF